MNTEITMASTATTSAASWEDATNTDIGGAGEPHQRDDGGAAASTGTPRSWSSPQRRWSDLTRWPNVVIAVGLLEAWSMLVVLVLFSPVLAERPWRHSGVPVSPQRPPPSMASPGAKSLSPPSSTTPPLSATPPASRIDQPTTVHPAPNAPETN